MLEVTNVDSWNIEDKPIILLPNIGNWEIIWIEC